VRLQTIPTRIFAIDTVISLFQRKKVVMDIAEFIQQIAQTHVLRMFAELELIRFAGLCLFSFPHGVSRITPFNPFTVGRTDTLPWGNAVNVGPT